MITVDVKTSHCRFTLRFLREKVGRGGEKGDTITSRKFDYVRERQGPRSLGKGARVVNRDIKRRKGGSQHQRILFWTVIKGGTCLVQRRGGGVLGERGNDLQVYLSGRNGNKANQ